ncbi:MAG: hypothetical protein HW416_1149 [Chloroflexi bacterium]|nr:hypothetical protein [Chloroflexota bacterium]
MQTSAKAVYLDSSALVKLAVEEPESSHLKGYLANRLRRVSCALARVEVVRAVRPHGVDAVAGAQIMLGDVYLLGIDNRVLDTAAQLNPIGLRSLDAIHLAAALSLQEDLGRLVTYDLRMASAARELGILVDTPGRP